MPQPNDLLDRRSLAQALTDLGLEISPVTLSSMASRGGGPYYHQFGRKTVYRWADAVRWVESKMKPPRGKAARVREGVR